MFMHSFFGPLDQSQPVVEKDATLLLSFSAGVLLGCLVAAPFSDLVGREISLSLLSSSRSAGACVLWLILPLLAGALFSLSGFRPVLAGFPIVLGFPFGYTVFFLLRFLGPQGLKASLLLLGANALTLPVVFWFLARRLQAEDNSLLQDLLFALALCLSVGLLAESVLAQFLRGLACAI